LQSSDSGSALFGRVAGIGSREWKRAERCEEERTAGAFDPSLGIAEDEYDLVKCLPKLVKVFVGDEHEDEFDLAGSRGNSLRFRVGFDVLYKRWVNVALEAALDLATTTMTPDVV
jgi:hypothetical protein